jgi:hypothetical protein
MSQQSGANHDSVILHNKSNIFQEKAYWTIFLLGVFKKGNFAISSEETKVY